MIVDVNSKLFQIIVEVPKFKHSLSTLKAKAQSGKGFNLDLDQQPYFVLIVK